MTVREYVSVFISIILGLALTDLLISFHRLIRVDARVRWYWVVPAIALYALLVIINFWWATYFWFAAVKTLSMSEFIPTLLAAIAIFLTVAAVLPDELPGGVLDLKEWYLRNAAHIWTLACCALGLVMLLRAKTELANLAWEGPASLAKPFLNYMSDEWDNSLALISFGIMVFTKRLRVHEAFVALNLIDMVYTSFRFQIG